MDFSQLTEFLGNHPVLTSALVLITVLLIGNEVTAKVRGFASVLPARAVQLINQQQAQVIDVRDASAFNKGHIAQASHSPLENLLKNSAGVKLDKTRPVIVTCETGQSANRAALSLKEAGFQSIYTLKGGIVAWRDDKLPLTRK